MGKSPEGLPMTKHFVTAHELGHMWAYYQAAKGGRSPSEQELNDAARDWENMSRWPGPPASRHW